MGDAEGMIEARFEAVPFADIDERVRQHLAALPSAIDSYLEEHILAATPYRIVVDGQVAGYASIHGGSLITQFSLDPPWRHLGQQLFAQVRRLEQVRSAFVPTCDELYLAHALDDYRLLTKQAYFFAVGSNCEAALPDGISLRLAQPDDIDVIRQESGDFFADSEGHIARQELFITLRMGEPVGFGLSIRSALYDSVASIGMYTIERHRRTGVGAATFSLLIDECGRHGLRPVAGCWYYNHASKRTLERAGMYAGTRLLKIEY